jgi:diacylglycerol kinase family enzyme
MQGRFFDPLPQANRVWIEQTSHPTHLETVLQWAMLQGIKKIAIWGGDGSFSRTLHWLWANDRLKDVSLALVPVGTGNDFSRAVGLWPWEKNVSRIFSGSATLTKIDLGIMATSLGERIFTNNAGFGRTPEAIAQKKSNPLQDILSLREKKVEISWTGEEAGGPTSLSTLMGIVFNAPYFNRGLYFDNTISPRDGRLNAVFIPPGGSLSLVWRFLKGRLGQSLQEPGDVWVSGHSIEVEATQDLYPQVDGERVFLKGVRRLNFSVLSQAFSLYI